MTVLLIILLIIVALLLICLVRALMLKPTEALTASRPQVDPQRTREYSDNLATMVKMETISSRYDPDRSKFYAFQKKLEELFPTVYSKCEQFHPGDGLVLYLKSENPTKDPILLMSHHDVVSATDEGWEHGCFSGDIDENGRIWGRGTVDTKSSLMCELQALEECLIEGFSPNADVYITSSCTEEWSGPSAPGIVAFLKERGVHLGMLMDEGGAVVEKPIGGVNGKYCVVGVVEKGYGDVKFTAHGDGGHSSTPTKNSPLPVLGKFMNDIDSHYPFKAEMSDNLVEMFTRMGPNASFGMKYLFANMWLFKPLLNVVLPKINKTVAAMMRTTIAWTTAKGSDGLNVIPTEAYVTANLRFIHHQSNDECLKILKERADKYNLEMEVIYQDYPCTPVSYKSEQFGLIEKVAAEVYPGYGVVPYIMTGGTDAKFYNSICENCLRFSPVEINNQQLASIHSLNENVDGCSLPPAVDFYKKILREYTK